MSSNSQARSSRARSRSRSRRGAPVAVTVHDDDSVATTELDDPDPDDPDPTDPGSAPATQIDDGDGREIGDDVVAIPRPDEPEMPDSVKPYLHYTNLKDRVLLCLEHPGYTSAHEMVFDICPPNFDWQNHLNFVLSDGLSVRNCKCFKFGISYTPHKRFMMDDYLFLRQMRVALVTESAALTAKAEERAIKRYRGDRRCMNVASGGQSAYHHMSPHFLYIVFGTREQFAMGKARQRAGRD